MQTNSLISILSGALLGFILGYANFRTLKVSVSTLVSFSKNAQSASSSLKAAFLYALLFFLKMFIITGVLAIALLIFHMHWIGLGIGLFISMVVSFIMILRAQSKLTVAEPH
jgi:uncharacterized membrane protein